MDVASVAYWTVVLVGAVYVVLWLIKQYQKAKEELEADE